MSDADRTGSADPAGTRGGAEDVVMRVEDLSVTFDMSRGASRVLDTVELDIERNEILGVVGESGSGKSMFASALMDAVVDPGHTTGDVTYYPPEGDPVDVLDLGTEELRRLRWEEVSMVFQGAMSSFNPTMTMRDHFEETLVAHDRAVESGLERARRILSDLYLDPDRVLGSYPHELSGGMSQRALIGLSLLLDPEVLVMDEPTAALDLLMQRSIISLLRDIQETYDVTILFITHDLPLVSELCDRVAVMYAFEFVEIAPTTRLLENARHPYTRQLLNATPNLQTSLEDMHPIDGSAPDPVNVPTGCSYHTRCALADEQCEQVDPDYSSVEGDDTHRAACHYWADSPGTIPLSTAADEPDDGTGTTASAESPDTATGETNEDREGEPVLELDGVSVHFDTVERGLFTETQTVRAVDDVSLDIHENDIVVLVGESGCGKTTLGKTAIGLQRPTDGAVRYRGQDVWAARDDRGTVDIPFEDIRHALQIIHQDPGSALNPNKTVLNSLTQPLKKRRSGLGANEYRKRIYKMLSRVDMTPPQDYASRYPHQLSGGEKQRVVLVRALLMNPDVILADEAVSALDVSLRIGMMDLMLELQDLVNTSYVFISHNLSNARYIARKGGGRIGIMYLGEIVELGRPEDVLTNPKHPYTRTLKWATPDLDPDPNKPNRPPVRDIDIPDAVDPPDGCRFHTRCPVARDVCTAESPRLASSDRTQPAACFRQYDDHEYWESEPLGAAGESGGS